MNKLIRIIWGGLRTTSHAFRPRQNDGKTGRKSKRGRGQYQRDKM